MLENRSGILRFTRSRADGTTRFVAGLWIFLLKLWTNLLKPVFRLAFSSQAVSQRASRVRALFRLWKCSGYAGVIFP
jgi:hypothetical protein